jgi:hypothetical protein
MTLSDDRKQSNKPNLFKQKLFVGMIASGLIMGCTTTAVVALSSINCRPVTVDVEFWGVKSHLHVGKCEALNK